MSRTNLSGSLWRYSLLLIKTALGINTAVLLLRGLLWGGAAQAEEGQAILATCYDMAAPANPPITDLGTYNNRTHPAFKDLEQAQTELDKAIGTYKFDQSIYDTTKKRVEQDINILLSAGEIDAAEADSIRSYFAVRLEYYAAFKQTKTCYYYDF
jgi:hypothetical protein